MNEVREITAGLSALQLMTSCRTMLDDLNKAVQHRQWQQAAQIAMDYSQLLHQIDAFDSSPHVMAELVQLDIYHRRTMRQLSSQMRSVTEDIHSLESGQKAAQRSQALAEQIYTQ